MIHAYVMLGNTKKMGSVFATRLSIHNMHMAIFFLYKCHMKFFEWIEIDLKNVWKINAFAKYQCSTRC
jgi:hypothetical protein